MPLTDDQTKALALIPATHMLATAAARDAAKALAVAESILARQVPEDTVRADIILTRAIAAKVGATSASAGG